MKKKLLKAEAQQESFNSILYCIPDKVHKAFTEDYMKGIDEIYKKTIPINIPQPEKNLGIFGQIESFHNKKYEDYWKYRAIADKKIKELWEKLQKKHYSKYEN